MTFGELVNQSDYAIKRDHEESLNIGVQSRNCGKMDPSPRLDFDFDCDCGTRGFCFNLL